MLQFSAAMLVALFLLSFHRKTQTYSESTTVVAHKTGDSRSWKNYALATHHHPLNAVLRGNRRERTTESGLKPYLAPLDGRRLGTFRRCGNSTLFCLVSSEECVESSTLTGFTCASKESPLFSSSPPTAQPPSVTPAVDAPVSVSEYWDDPKTYTSSRAAKNPSKWMQTGAKGMAETYDTSDSESVNPLFYIFLAIFLVGLVGCCAKMCCGESDESEE